MQHQEIAPKSNWGFWSFLSVIFIIEFLLFNQFVSRNIAPFYPASFDQASYLPVLYLFFENIKKYGLIASFSHSPSLATGILFPIQSAIAFILWGASRHTALLVNFLYFVALQISSVIAMKSVSKENYFSFAFLGILLAINTPFFLGGGMFDVRLDFMAFCLYGIFINLVIKSDFFISRKWSLAAGTIACLTILLRSLSLVYFVGVLGILFLYLLIKRTHKQQILNILLCSLLISTVTLPLIWLNREALYNYYFIGHVFGSEKYIRLAEAQITNTFSELLYYPNMLLTHFGNTALFLCAIVLSLFGLMQRRAAPSDRFKIGYVFLLAAILFPMLVLTMDTSKSPVVGGIMVIPTIWLIFWFSLSANIRSAPSASKLRIMINSAWVVLFIGVFCQIKELNHHYSQRRLTELNAITDLYLDIGNYATSKKMTSVKISFDRIQDYLTSGGIATLYYESTGKFLNIGVGRLGGMIFAISQKEALDTLKRSDIFVMNLGTYTAHSNYPFDESVKEIHPLLKTYAEKHFKVLGDYSIKNATYRVYVAK